MSYIITYNPDGTLSLVESGSIFLADSASKPPSRPGKGESNIVFLDDYVVIDLETTGFYSCFDEIIELAALRVRNRMVVDTFVSLVKPSDLIDEYITELTGISNAMVNYAPCLRDVLPRYLSFLGGDVVVGHNVSFDVGFLYDYSVELFGNVFGNNYVDTMRISRKLYPEHKHHRLKDLVKRLNYAPTGAHRALADCETAFFCYERMREDALRLFSSLDAFEQSCKRNDRHSYDARSVSTENTDFDTSHALYGKVCVFTGVLERMTRMQAAQLVVDLGGSCGNSVTKDTDYLVLGNNDYCKSIKDGKSNKQKKAEALRLSGQDISVIPEDVFYDMIES